MNFVSVVDGGGCVDQFSMSTPAKDTYPTYSGSARNPPESGKADLQFRRKQSLTVCAKNVEAVGQTGMPVLLAVRLLGSVTGPSPRVRNFCRVLRTGHCRCWSSFGIRGLQKLGSCRSTEDASVLG